ncbi:hypothetical protein [Endozoicomonas sp. SESOKO3]|nr:hypothetical protein [Endozoicomonas sp. SESOKO3]
MPSVLEKLVYHSDCYFGACVNSTLKCNNSGQTKPENPLDLAIPDRSTIVNLRHLSRKHHLEQNIYAHMQVKTPKTKDNTDDSGIVYTASTNRN